MSDCSFILNTNLNIQRVSRDNTSYHSENFSHEKTYSLEIENSISFENKFFVQNHFDKTLGFVEISLKNMMRHSALLSKFDVTGSDDARYIETIEMDSPVQEIPKKSTFRAILKFELNKGVFMVKNYGKVQFLWGSSKPEIEGGVLAYSLISNLDKAKYDVSVERVDQKVLKVGELTEIELAVTNK